MAVQATQKLYAAVMAAGKSARFGEPKQLVEIGGESIVERACRIAREVCAERTLLVTGHEWHAVQASSRHPFFVINEDYETGLGSSIASAARALAQTAPAILVTLADQVRITADDLERLRAQHAAAPDAITASRYSGTLGPPIIFPAGAFAELISLDGRDGAKRLLSSNRYGVTSVDCENAALDIDRPADLEALTLARQSD